MSEPTQPRTTLTLAEELLLVALDDATGMLINLPPFSLEVAVAAGLLMELTLANRIDTDLNKLFVVSAEPTGDAVLDEILTQICAEPQSYPTAVWLNRLAQPRFVLRDRIIQRLVERGVLKSVEKRLLWVFKTRVYPPTSGIEEREVKSRVMTLLNSNEIPNTRDALLVGLLRATSMFDFLLTPSELERLTPRINQVADLEEINRTLSHTVSELQRVLAAAYAPPV